ncbi:MAG: AAA family ATPase, partial [Oscillospiraceae bacterium]
IVVGDAGTGKTFSSQAIFEAFEKSDYSNHIVAPTWKAAQGVGRELEITQAAAIAGFLNKVNRGQIELNNKSAVMIDEAGMIGTRTMHKLLKLSEQTGCKLILMGDPKQLNAIEAGPSMAILMKHAPNSRIAKIRRQDEEWARVMVTNLANGETSAGLKALDEKGGIKIAKNRDDVLKMAVDDWKASTNELKWTPKNAEDKDKSLIMIAVKNQDVFRLNNAAREYLKAAGLISKVDITVRCQAIEHQGDGVNMNFSVGDRIVLRKNELKDGIINREEALLTKIDPMEDGSYNFHMIKSNGDKEILNTKKYVDDKGDFAATNGYAVSMYSSQGMTVRRSFVVADGMGQRYSYVGLSRHKEQTTLYANKQSLKETFARNENIKPNKVTNENIKTQLFKTLSRKTDKKSTLDFKVDTAFEKFMNKIMKESDKQAIQNLSKNDDTFSKSLNLIAVKFKRILDLKKSKAGDSKAEKLVVKIDKPVAPVAQKVEIKDESKIDYDKVFAQLERPRLNKQVSQSHPKLTPTK